MKRALVLGAIAAMTACFSLRLQDGAIRCSDDPEKPCPIGYSCVNQHCYLNSDSFPDSGTD
jgi:hypothetical protein